MEGPLYHCDAGLYSRLCRLRKPLTWDDEQWLVTGYAEAHTVLTRPDVFVSAYGTGRRSLPHPAFQPHNWNPADPPFRSLNLSDPPFHTGLRSALEAWFSERLRCIGPGLRQRVEHRVASAGCDLVADIAEPLPWEALCMLLDISPRPELLACVKDIAFAPSPGEWRRAEDQLLKQLPIVNSLPFLEGEDRVYLTRLLLLAGWASTRAALGSLVVTMAGQNALPVARFSEEVLRWASPLSRFGRLVAKPFVLGEVPLEVGQRVMVIFPATNRDAAVFSEPDRFRADRCPNPHLAFGAGPHACLGARLARAQLRWTAEALWQRGRFHLVEPPQPLPSPFTLGPANLKVRWE